MKRGAKRLDIQLGSAAQLLLYPEIELTQKAAVAIRDIQKELVAFVELHARIHGSKTAARVRVLEYCPDKEIRKVVDTIFKLPYFASRERLKAEELLSLRRIFKNLRAPKRITDADFAVWYHCEAKIEPKQKPLAENEILAMRQRLTRARKLSASNKRA